MQRVISGPRQARRAGGLPKRVREAAPTPEVGHPSSAKEGAPHEPPARVPERPRASFSGTRMLVQGPPAALAVLSCIGAGELNPFVWLLMYVICLVPWGAFLLALALWLDFLAHPDRVPGRGC